MAITVPGHVKKLANRPIRWGPGNARKIGLLGTYRATLWTAPWSDPSWEFWANISATNFLPANRVDLFWEMHPEFVFTERQNDAWEHLQRCRIPVMMQEQHKDVPASARNPIEQMRTEFPGLHYSSQTAYQIALALIYGATDIGLWGIEYGHATEYERQRGNCQMWLGIAIGRGVKVHTPPGCTLLDEVVYDLAHGKDYGYDLTKEQYALDVARFREAITQQPALSKERLVDVTGDPAALKQAEAKRMQNKDFAAAMEKINQDPRQPAWMTQLEGETPALDMKNDYDAEKTDQILARQSRKIQAEADLRAAQKMQAGVQEGERPNRNKLLNKEERDAAFGGIHLKNTFQQEHAGRIDAAIALGGSVNEKEEVPT